jgi:hypothetical protein
VVRIQDHRKPKQAMEVRREKRRGRGRPRRTWEDCVIDVAMRKRNTLADMRRLAGDRTAFRQWTEYPTLQGNRDRYRRRRIRKYVEVSSIRVLLFYMTTAVISSSRLIYFCYLSPLKRLSSAGD